MQLNQSIPGWKSSIPVFTYNNHFLRKAIKASFILLSALAISGFSNLRAEEAVGKISKQLEAIMDQAPDAAIPVIVVMRPTPLIPYSNLFQMSTGDVERVIKQRVASMQVGLKEFVQSVNNQATFDNSEKPIRNWKFFWNVNAMMATVHSDMVYELADRDDVWFVMYDRKIQLERGFREVELTGDYTYGLTKIGIPQLRAANPDINGQGVTVGIVDTGIDAAHPELAGRTIAFKDFVGNKKDPYDDNGHGTHVAGTIGGAGVGGTQIGIAPNVKYVIAKVFSAGGSAATSEILRGMEWISNPDGKPETKDQPGVVNNSWGGSLGDELERDPFSQAVLTWVQLNIFPSFAAGNAGPYPSSVGTPGGLPQSFAVGATDQNDQIARFSSRGPVQMKIGGKEQTYTKPDISAPGVDVVSSIPGGRYGEMSGTSMATPHLTGSVALLLQMNPQLKVAQIRDILAKSSDSKGDPNSFGAGRLNIFKAVQKLEAAMN